MPRWIRLLLVVLPLALVAILATAACDEPAAKSSAGQPAQGAASGPKISVDEDSVDFGRVPLDKEVRKVFNVKNVGSETLQLRQVQVKVLQGC